MFGHLLPLFIHAVPGVVFNGVPPYSLWEYPPVLGRIRPHRTDAG
jgi:molybdenum storage protein